MKRNQLITRWEENPENIKSHQNIIELLVKGNLTLSADLTPFGVTSEGMLDFRGLNFNKIYMYKSNNFNNIDFSFSEFEKCWIVKSNFTNTKLENVKFTSFIDRGSKFTNCNFNNSVFQMGSFGYNNSKFIGCNFVKVKFMGLSFSSPDFIGCKFENCIYKHIDFRNSCLIDCIFIGKISDVWFRGYDPDIYFKSKEIPVVRNKMLNVSFENASLEDITISDECDLSTIKLPNDGRHFLYNNWKQRLKRLVLEIKEWPDSHRKEAEIFARVNYRETQDWDIVNMDELIKESGSEIAEKIINSLNKELGLSI